MEKREIYKKLWHSLDMRYAQEWGFLGIISYAVLSLADMRVAGVLVLLPCLGYGWWLRWKLLRKAEAYEFARAKLVQPHSEFRSGWFSFAGILEDGSDVWYTNRIFATHINFAPQMQDYVNRTVTLAYNRETDQVVVIE